MVRIPITIEILQVNARRRCGDFTALLANRVTGNRRLHLSCCRPLPALRWSSFWLNYLLHAVVGLCRQRFDRREIPPVDQHRMREELFVRHFRAMQLEAFRQGSRGGAYESFLEYRPWEFDLAEVSVPTHIWLGDRDSFVPRTMGEYLESAIPGVDFHWAEGKGHFGIEDWDAIFAACAGDIGTRRWPT